MHIIVGDNNSNNQSKFDILSVSKQDWDRFIKSVLLERAQQTKGIKLYPASVTVRENRAKVIIRWEDKNYHEFIFHIDECGRVSKNYQDIVSQIWQNIMTEYYGEEYVAELNARLNELKSKTI